MDVDDALVAHVDEKRAPEDPLSTPSGPPAEDDEDDVSLPSSSTSLSVASGKAGASAIVAAAFARETGIDILATAPDPLEPSLDLLAASARPLGIAPRPGDRWDDLFFRIFLDHIEPKLGMERPTILYEYPVSMAALSRPKLADPRVCERFELYVAGLELATDALSVVNAALERGLVINRTSATTLRLLPPYIITERDVDEAMGILSDALKAV